MASSRSRCSGSRVSSASRNTERPSSGRRAHGVCLFGPRVRPRSPDDATVKILAHRSDNRGIRAASIARASRARRRLGPDRITPHRDRAAPGARITQRATRSTVGAVALPASRDRLRGPAHEPHVSRARGGVRDLPLASAPRRDGPRPSSGGAAASDRHGRSALHVDRRRHARTDARPRRRRKVEELPLVVQRAGARASKGSLRRRHRRRRAG